MNFVSLTAEHAMRLGALMSVHRGFVITPEVAVELEAIGGTAALDGDRVVAMAGILPRWDGVGMAWAWLSRDWRRAAREITTAAEAGLDASEFRRIEAGVRVDYPGGHAWVRRLGFVLETPLAIGWGPDGGDYSIYSRIRNDGHG